MRPPDKNTWREVSPALTRMRRVSGTPWKDLTAAMSGLGRHGVSLATLKRIFNGDSMPSETVLDAVLRAMGLDAAEREPWREKLAALEPRMAPSRSSQASNRDVRAVVQLTPLHRGGRSHTIEFIDARRSQVVAALRCDDVGGGHGAWVGRLRTLLGLPSSALHLREPASIEIVGYYCARTSEEIYGLLDWREPEPTYGSRKFLTFAQEHTVVRAFKPDKLARLPYIRVSG